MYSATEIDRYFNHIEQLGGVDLILINHRDEAGDQVQRLADRFQATVHAHAAEVDVCVERGISSIEPLDGDRSDLGADLVAFHTPGHTPGVVSYLWTGPQQTSYLFTNDTLSNLNFGELAGHLLNPYRYEGNVEDLRNSMTLIRATPTDVLVPGIGQGSVEVYPWTVAERQKILDPQIAELAD